MNLEFTAQLREPLQALLNEASRINRYKPQRYWYPLSVATYDVEEILAAVDSLCSFRTTMWEKTAEFERQFGDRMGHLEAVMANSGSSAELLIGVCLGESSGKATGPGRRDNATFSNLAHTDLVCDDGRSEGAVGGYQSGHFEYGFTGS